MTLVHTEKKHVGTVLTKFDYYDNNTVKIYEYCGCSGNPWKYIRQANWVEVNGSKVIT